MGILKRVIVLYSIIDFSSSFSSSLPPPALAPPGSTPRRPTRKNDTMNKSICFNAGLPFLFLVLPLIAPATTLAEEPLPPNCNEFLGRKCDRALQTCLFANQSSHERQCKCYELSVGCLKGIDPTECLRGAHCALFYNACTQFYCKDMPERCTPCFAASEIDIPHAERSMFLKFATSPPGAILIIVIVLASTYHCFFFGKRVYGGESCECATCPNYDRCVVLLNSCRRTKPRRHRHDRKKQKKRKKKQKKQKKQRRKSRGEGLNAPTSKFQTLDEDEGEDEDDHYDVEDEGIGLVEHRDGSDENADGDDSGMFDVSELDQLRMLEEYRETLGNEMNEVEEEGVPVAAGDGKHTRNDDEKGDGTQHLR